VPVNISELESSVIIWMIILMTTFCLLTKYYWIVVLYKQTTIRHSPSNITICIYRYPFSAALGMISTWKLWKIQFSNIKVQNFNEYMWKYNTCIKKTYADIRTQTLICVFYINASSLLHPLVSRKHRQASQVYLSPLFCNKTCSKTHVFLQIRQTHWCLLGRRLA
jgi:hypothetical protein